MIHDGLSKSDKTAITLITGIGKKLVSLVGPWIPEFIKKLFGKLFLDANKWSEERLSLLFGDIDIADGPFQMKIKKMASCSGESMASNRKNKLICYWDYELELKWECVKKINANDKITGIYFATVECIFQIVILSA